MARRSLDLSGFRTSLTRSGKRPRTVDVYVSDVGMLLRGGDPVGELLDDRRAPLTRRRLLASLRAWALYADDERLTKDLRKLRMPPKARRTTRQPMTEHEWRALVAELDTASYLEEPVRLVLCIMARRGFRAGDLLRCRRSDLVTASRTGTLRFEAKGGRIVSYTTAQFSAYLDDLLEHTGRWERVEDLLSPGAADPGRAAWKRVSKALHAVGARLGWRADATYTHRLRRTYAVRFLRAMHGDPEALQKLQTQMQWQGRETLFEYTDFVRQEDLDAVEKRMR